jgi:hypothetical protein
MGWRVECEGHPKHKVRKSQFHWIQHWQDGHNPCPSCGKPLHWYGEWRPQKSDAGAPPRPYEVLTVIRVNAEDSPTRHSRWDDVGYFPVLMVCRNRQNPDEYILWPRYWLAPAKYGQEGPQLWVEEWDYLLSKAKECLKARGH